MYLIAAFLGVLPMYSLAVIGGLGSDISPLSQMPTPTDALIGTFVDLFIFGGIMLAALFVLNGETLADLNLHPGTLGRDLLLSLGLLATLLLGLLILGQVITRFGYEGVPDANLELGKALAADPALMLVFLGPVIWLKAAVLEEFSRVFFLSRLLRVYSSSADRFAVLLLSSLMFGLGHIWEGPIGIVGTSVIGFILGWHYLKHGRVLPLIVVHGVYDMLVLGLLAYMSQHPELLPR
jgi:membrane protease YdiL (CAAX protease family)